MLSLAELLHAIPRGAACYPSRSCMLSLAELHAITRGAACYHTRSCCMLSLAELLHAIPRGAACYPAQSYMLSLAELHAIPRGAACYPSRICMLSLAELHAIPHGAACYPAQSYMLSRAVRSPQLNQYSISIYLYQRGGNRPRFYGCHVWRIPSPHYGAVMPAANYPNQGTVPPHVDGENTRQS